MLRKALVALRTSEDLQRITSLLKRMEEHPRLVVSTLEFHDLADSTVAKIENIIPNDKLIQNLNGFEFEIARLDYRAERLPASTFVEEAIKSDCDIIIVVSSAKSGLFHTDLGSTLAGNSSIPVLVVQ